MAARPNRTGLKWIYIFGVISVAIGIIAATHATPEWQGPILVTFLFVGLAGGLIAMFIHRQKDANAEKDEAAGRKAMLNDFFAPTKRKVPRK